VITDWHRRCGEDAFKRGTGTEAYGSGRMIGTGATRADIYSFSVVLRNRDRAAALRLPHPSAPEVAARPEHNSSFLGRRWDQVILRCLTLPARFQQPLYGCPATEASLDSDRCVLAGLLAWPLISRLIDGANGDGDRECQSCRSRSSAGQDSGWAHRSSGRTDQEESLIRTKWMVSHRRR
jgi:hypothetical protein